MKAFEKPLSAKEEKEMIERFHNGDMEARNILVERNMRLVAHMVKKYLQADRDTDDLISVGTIGLIKAVIHSNRIKVSGWQPMPQNALIMNC